MKFIASVVTLTAMAAAIPIYLGTRSSTTVVAPQPAATRTTADADCPQCAQLAQQIQQLQQNLTTVRSQVASQHARESEPHARPEEARAAAAPAESSDLEATRAAETEKHRAYMAEADRAFQRERVDPSWSGHASTKVSTILDTDETLRDFGHSVECRTDTCRVQIDDDGTGKVSERLPFLAMGVSEVLPTIIADRVEQGNGRGAMVLYLSTQQPTPPAK